MNGLASEMHTSYNGVGKPKNNDPQLTVRTSSWVCLIVSLFFS